MSTNNKHNGKVQDNYDRYLAEPRIIGCMETFPITKIIEEMTVSGKCRGFDVVFKVQYVTLTFGKNKIEVQGIVTSEVNINHRLPLHGFSSYCHIDEAETMEQGVIHMLKRRNLMVCTKINSWPFAKVVVQENFYKD